MSEFKPPEGWPAHCETCGQAKWLSRVFPEVERQRDSAFLALATLEKVYNDMNRTHYDLDAIRKIIKMGLGKP